LACIRESTADGKTSKMAASARRVYHQLAVNLQHSYMVNRSLMPIKLTFGHLE